MARTALCLALCLATPVPAQDAPACTLDQTTPFTRDCVVTLMRREGMAKFTQGFASGFEAGCRNATDADNALTFGYQTRYELVHAADAAPEHRCILELLASDGSVIGGGFAASRVPPPGQPPDLRIQVTPRVGGAIGNSPTLRIRPAAPAPPP
ncbi:hypothetical protein RNZ50_19705 [Paracoccaceae bacterium Fryx2]|nr:hypothetical protein [Paracoccaceae bacterium Fryx2]